jgi:hypothetical protein
MAADFELENSRWYSLMKLGLECRNARTSAEGIIKWAPLLGNFEYEPTAGTELAKAETALSEALLAVKLARKQYEKYAKHPKPHLVAAE